MTEQMKIVVVGDVGTGKTCLIITYENNSFPGDYIPTVFSNYSPTILHKNKHISLGLWDTAGQSDYDRLRPLSYPETNAFIVCFSVVDHTSLQNVKDKWIPELTVHGHATTPTFLVATKIDLRNDEENLEKLSQECLKPITKEQGEMVCKELKLHSYFETSAKLIKGLKEPFIAAVDVVLFGEEEKTQKNDKCSIL